jgi:hypothetical protein
VVKDEARGDLARSTEYSISGVHLALTRGHDGGNMRGLGFYVCFPPGSSTAGPDLAEALISKLPRAILTGRGHLEAEESRGTEWMDLAMLKSIKRALSFLSPCLC